MDAPIAVPDSHLRDLLHPRTQIAAWVLDASVVLVAAMLSDQPTGPALTAAVVLDQISHRLALQRWPDRKPGIAWPNIGINFDTTQTWWNEG